MACFWWQSVLPPVPKNASNACACALVLVSQFWVVPPPEGEFLMQPVHQTASYIQTGENLQTKLESFKEQVSTYALLCFNPICTGLFWCIRYRGGHIVPPLNIFGLGRVRVPILFGNYFPRSDLPYTKGFMKFGCPQPSKTVFDFWNFCSSKRRLTRFVRVPPYGIWVFPTNFIFFQGNKITLRGKKCAALFQTHNWEKSSFFNGLVRVFAKIYANT